MGCKQPMPLVSRMVDNADSIHRPRNQRKVPMGYPTNTQRGLHCSKG